ncbi:E3 ubiquitin-protein ligase RNF212B isoform X2 [Dendropsophus ebraccatus]|uniref:E3 ubiquitin-protein ligase RNF212B isoform X2 n=1 Tax=Dendropsophus ebraccatus TaxID=150705 RepID=UPI0038321274
MDWFHCNVCHMHQETTFYVTSCGHILCKTCITQDYCSVCRTACKYLPVSESAWSFQKQQHEHRVTFYKQYITKLQNSYQEALQKIEKQENELKAIKRENVELKTIITQLKSSLSRSQSSSRSCTSRPIAITPPSQTVTPRHNFQQYGQITSHSSSAESLLYVRSHSVTGSPSPSASRLQGRNTPIGSSLGSPSSGRSMYYRDRTDVLSDQSQTPNETNNIFRNSAFVRDSFNTPCNNIDRLRAIQLKFTPKITGSLNLRK